MNTSLMFRKNNEEPIEWPASPAAMLGEDAEIELAAL